MNRTRRVTLNQPVKRRRSTVLLMAGVLLAIPGLLFLGYVLGRTSNRTAAPPVHAELSLVPAASLGPPSPFDRPSRPAFVVTSDGKRIVFVGVAGADDSVVRAVARCATGKRDPGYGGRAHAIPVARQPVGRLSRRRRHPQSRRCGWTGRGGCRSQIDRPGHGICAHPARNRFLRRQLGRGRHDRVRAIQRRPVAGARRWRNTFAPDDGAQRRAPASPPPARWTWCAADGGGQTCGAMSPCCRGARPSRAS